jgi:hypothetical protein
MKRAFAVAIPLACVLAGAAHATELVAKVSGTISVLELVRSTRGAGMGGTGVADPATPQNIHLNPANAVGSGGLSVYYLHDDFLNVYSTDHAGVSYSSPTRGDGWRWGAEARYHRWTHDFENRTVFLPEGTGQMVDIDDRVTSVTAAGAMVRSPFTVALGATASYIDNEFAEDEITGWTYDVGARADWSWRGDTGDEATIRAGVAVRRLDNDLESDSYVVSVDNQVRFGLGLDYRPAARLTNPISGRDVPIASFAFNIEYVDQNDPFDRTGAAMGIEAGFAEMLYLRGGGIDNVNGYSDGGSWGIGVAMDARVVRIRLDVAGYPLGGQLIDADNTVYGVTVDYRP